MNKPTKNNWNKLYTVRLGTFTFDAKTSKEATGLADKAIDSAFSADYTPHVLTVRLPDGTQVLGTLWRDPFGYQSRIQVIHDLGRYTLGGSCAYAGDWSDFARTANIYRSFAHDFFGHVMGLLPQTAETFQFLEGTISMIAYDFQSENDIRDTWNRHVKLQNKLSTWRESGFDISDNRVIELAMGGVSPGQLSADILGTLSRIPVVADPVYIA